MLVGYVMSPPYFWMARCTGWSRWIPRRSTSTLADVRPIAGMTSFDLLTTIPPYILPASGGLLIVWFAVMVLDECHALRAPGVREVGFVLWRGMAQ